MEAMFFTLSATDSQDFARLSGDFNPLHVDPVAARRLQFGSTICHGVHQALKALDLAVEAQLLAPAQIAAIATVFNGSLQTGCLAEVQAVLDGVGRLAKLSVGTGGRALFTVRVTLEDGLPQAGNPLASDPELPRQPHCPNFPQQAEVAALAGTVPLRLNGALAKQLFPSLAVAPQGLALMADLLATTRVIGMECPGLHSIYSELKLRRLGQGDLASQMPPGTLRSMAYAVQHCDPRFRSVRIGVTGNTLGGTLNAFFRAPPVSQVTLQELLSLVSPDRFAGQKALVVGGSRGLGELVAKTLLAGGAEVTLTYSQGKADAERIRQEAWSAGRSARILHFDASAVADTGLLVSLPTAAFTHLYHFATPQIAKNTSGRWSNSLFDGFCKLYLHAFANLVRAVAPEERRLLPLVALYPSTIFLDKPPRGFAEYCAAKAAGEALCDHLELSHNVRIHKPRLPRLQTDQNSSFLGVEGESPLPVMLAYLAAMHPESPGLAELPQEPA